MITSPDMLRKDTVEVLNQINAQIETIQKLADEVGCKPAEVRDGYGALMLSPLLLAKVMAISTLVELNQSLQSRGRRP